MYFSARPCSRARAGKKSRFSSSSCSSQAAKEGLLVKGMAGCSVQCAEYPEHHVPLVGHALTCQDVLAFLLHHLRTHMSGL